MTNNSDLFNILKLVATVYGQNTLLFFESLFVITIAVFIVLSFCITVGYCYQFFGFSWIKTIWKKCDRRRIRNSEDWVESLYQIQNSRGDD